LIFVELAVFVLALALVLEGDDDETDEDVHHEEGDDDDERDEEDGDRLARVVHRTAVLRIRVDGHVEQTVVEKDRICFCPWVYLRGIFPPIRAKSGRSL
jgi:hypothetical protein